MVNFTQVSKAADDLRRRNEPVTQRTVIPWLQKHYRGASCRDLGPLLKRWKSDNNYYHRIAKADLPEAVQHQLAMATEALWKAAREALDVEVRHVRDDLDLKDAEIATRDARIEELTARLALIEPEHGRLAGENARLGAENASLRAELDGAEKRLRRVRAVEFWDRVMRELHDLVPAGAWLTPEEIEPYCPRDLVGEARGHEEGWSTTVLAKKLYGRDYHGRYFVRDENTGRYARRPGVEGTADAA